MGPTDPVFHACLYCEKNRLTERAAILRVKHYVHFRFIDCTGTYKHFLDVIIDKSPIFPQNSAQDGLGGVEGLHLPGSSAPMGAGQ
jgi:hypothetical protein